MFFSRPEGEGRSRESWFRAWAVMFIVCVVLIILCKKTPFMQPMRHQLYTYAYAPAAAVLQSPLRLVSRSFTGINRNQILLDNAKALETENEELRAQVQLMGHYQAENRRLRMLMDSVGNVTEPVMIAELLDTDIEGYRETITINKGSEDGVYPQQAVIDPYGLVGQVTDVHPHSAMVMLITDGRSRVPVYVERTHERALVSGSAEKGVLMMPNMRLDSDIRVGDKLVSSGLGGVFPRGYPVAQIAAVERNQRGSFLTIQLKSLAQLSSMLEVLLLDQRNIPDSPVLPVGPPLPPSMEKR